MQHTAGQRSCQGVEDSLGGVSKEKKQQTLCPLFCSFPFLQSSTCLLAALHISRDGCMLRLRESHEDQGVALKPGYMINMQDRVLTPAVNLLFRPAVRHCAWHLQPLSCRNVRWLHLLLFMGELGSLSYMHGEGLPSDRGSLQRRTAGIPSCPDEAAWRLRIYVPLMSQPVSLLTL